MTILLAKATLALGVALALAVMARRASASTRHAILVAGQLAALIVPLLAPVVPPIDVDAELWSAVAGDTAFQAAAHAAAVQSAPAARRWDPVPIIWMAGAVMVAAMRMRSIVRAHRIARRARPWNGVFLSEEIDQPMAVGSRILLPHDAPEWSAEDLAAVLLHERAHVRRRDWLLGLFGDAACAVYWFHPLAWLAARRTRLEREQACDETVLAAGVPGPSYAGMLLAMARSALAPAHGMPMAHRSHLEIRIGAILAGAAPHPLRTARAMVGVALVAAAPLLAALTPLVIPRPTASEPDLRGDSPPSSEWIGAAPVEVAAAGPDAALIARLQELAAQPRRSDEDLVPDRARWALARVRGGELVRPLLDALNDGDWRVRAYAAWGLGISRDRRATSALLPFLDDPIWRIRAMGAFALAKIADPAAYPAMRRALADPAWQVRMCAVDYFGALGDRRLVQAMRDDRHMAVRSAAEDVLR